jgi:hypothetical protein
MSYEKALIIGNSNNAILTYLFSVVVLSLLSLSMMVTMANAQTTSSNSTSGNNSTTGNGTSVKQMGICQIGAESLQWQLSSVNLN